MFLRGTDGIGDLIGGSNNSGSESGNTGKDDDATPTPTPLPDAVAARLDPSYWCEYYGQNRCPFYINALGIETTYYFRDGGDFANWVYTEENTGNWYIKAAR